MKNRFIFILLLTFLTLYAQSDLVWQNYTTDNGLPQNSVKDIIRDKYGFIWIATENGITRFDGSQFVTIDNQNNKKRYRNFWGNIEKDSIFNVDETGRTTLFIKKRKLLEKTISTKYFKTRVSYNGHKYALYNKNSSITPRMDKDRVYINTGKYIYFFEKSGITYYNPLTNIGKKIKIPFNVRFLKDIFICEDSIFISFPDYKKMIKINKEQVSIVDSNSLYTEPQSIIYWSQGNEKVYIIHKDFLYKSIYGNDKLSVEKIAYIPNFNKKLNLLYINSIVYDKQTQHLFLGSLTKGLYVVTLPQFSTPTQESSFAGNVFYATLPFDSHSIITPQGNIYDSISQIIKPQKNGNADIFNDYNKYSLAINKAEDIFFIKNNALYKRLKAYQYDKYTKVPIDEEIDAVYSKDKQLYVVYIKNDKYYLSEYNDDLQKTDPLFYFNYPVNDVKKYNDQQLLIAGLNGLYMGDTSKKEIKKLLNYPIKKIIQTSDHNIWIVTKNHGFFLFRKNKFIRMPLDEKSYLLDPHTILEDHQQNLWISTNNGLFKVKMQNLLQFSSQMDKPVGYYRYTMEDGLPTNELNGGGNPNANILSNGQMVFPSLDGLVFFRPDKVKSFHLKSTDFYIDRAQLDGHKMTIENNTVNIPNNNFNALEIFVDFPYFNNLNNVDLHVSLDGSAWIDLGLQRKHTLENLTPGNHQVKFRYLDENNNYIYKTVDVKVGFFFYQSQYFKISVAVVTILLAYLLIKSNERQLRSKNELLAKANTEINAQKEEINSSNIIREKLIEAISHDIATPIKHLSHLSKKLNETDSLEIQKKYFHSIHKSSELLYRFTLELGNYAFLFTGTVEETLPYPLNELIMEKKVFFENIAQDNDTELIFHPKEELYIQTNKSVLAAIIHNIIDNAVKNTTEGHIIIDIAHDNSFVYIKITDEGNGMSPEQIYYYNNLHSILIEDVQLQKKGSGYGLKFVLLLIDKIKSQITFNNNVPKGTKVEIKIPKLKC
ncbi:two-component regulator propeller domain-containing protein [Chryseobacterium sp. S90]|uniref:sensor histidine kinase n=1 Tax=Chryseobacterium sp. S90 TaxID=3395373 RepID=UPI0039BD1E33